MSVPAPVKFRLVIAYDGTAYQGWQVQKIGVGVQQKVEEAFARLYGAPLRLHGSSRTDTGVHARGMVAHVEVPSTGPRLSAVKLPLALNAHLPEDIRVLSARRCAADFHARFDACGKQYRYFIWNHPAHHPLLRHYAWHIPRPLDLPAMRAAARHFLGRHDFKSLAASRNYPMRSTVRTITRLDLRRSGPQLVFIIEGDGFLYKMCRSIVGTLVQAGLGKLAPASIPAMLARRDRRVAGMSAPAHGLVLWRVFYPRRGQRPAPAAMESEE